MATWTNDSDVVDGLSDVGDYPTPCAFLDGETWKLIAGRSTGTFTGWYWSGSAWVYDSSIVSGLGDVGSQSAPTIFDDDGTWKLIAGEDAGNFNGFYWTGSTWTSDSSIVSGLGDVGTDSKPTVFLDGSTWKLIAGEYAGTLNGFYWSGSTWVSDSDVVDGLSDIGYNSTPYVFLDGSTLKIIIGEDNGSFNGFYWTGSTWTEDTDIVDGLVDPGDHSTPCVFVEDGYFRLITGKKYGGFVGYTGPASIQTLYDTVSDTMVSSLLTDIEFILEHSISGTHTPTLEGLSFGTTKALTESSSFSFADPFTLVSTQSLTESSVFSYPSELGITKSFSSTHIPTTELLFKLVKILSTANSLSLDNPFTLASTMAATESSNLLQIPITDYHKTQSFNSSANITTKIAWTLTKSLIMSGVPTVTAALISALVASVVATGTPLSPTLFHTVSKIITETSNLSIISKFFLEILLSGTYIPTSFDAFIDSASFSGSGTPSAADILTLHLIPSFQLTGLFTTPSKFTLFDKTFSMSGIVSAKDVFPLQILLTQTVTGTPLLTFKFILSTSDTTSILPSFSSLKGTYEVISFSNSVTPTISKTLDLVPTLSITIVDNLSLASDIVLKLISSIASGSFNVTPLSVASASTTMTGVPSKTTAWATSQSLSQSDSFTIEDFTSYTKTIEKAAVLTPAIIKVLNLFTTLSRTVSTNIATQFIQTLLAIPTASVTGTPSTDLNFILEQVFTGQGVFSEISKFFITAILTSEMSNTVDAHFTLKDSFSVSFEGIPLASFFEVLIGKLSLVLSDSTIKELTLEDTTIKGLVLEDNPIKTLTLEDT